MGQPPNDAAQPETLKNSFQVPNLYVDRLMHLLTSEEWVVLMFIVRTVGSNTDAGTAITHASIGKATRLCVNTVSKCLQALRAVRVVSTSPLGLTYCDDPLVLDWTYLLERKAEKRAKDQKRSAAGRDKRTAKREAFDPTTGPDLLRKNPAVIPGFVYFAKRSDGIYKIGASQNPTQRVRQLGRGLDLKIRMVLCIPSEDMYASEVVWLNRFKSRCVGGEWFRLTDADVNQAAMSLVVRELETEEGSSNG